jgi:hypothetical protein
MRNLFVLSLTAVLTAACSSTQQSLGDTAPVMVMEPVAWPGGDSLLAPLLTQPELSEAKTDSLIERLGLDFYERLATISEDTTAPWMVRVNALRVLSQHRIATELPTFATALSTKDERVRISAAASMRDFLPIRPEATVELLAFALKDKSARVQSAALEVLSDRDADVLRAYLPNAASPALRGIALDLIRASEERGFALTGDSAGVLTRSGPNGSTLTFRPTTRWPQWEAAVGDLILTLPKQQPVVVARGVEQVGNVVPAFFTANDSTLVYEVNREIRARNVATGADIKLADGIAPRVLPFSNVVIFLRDRPKDARPTRDGSTLHYDVMRIPATGGTADLTGSLTTSVSHGRRGSYSPARWFRIIENEGNFYLSGENMEPFLLPSPFDK